MLEIHGLDEVLRKLDRLKSNAQSLDGHHEVKASDLFTPAFMRLHTKVSTFEALIEAGGFKVESQADFDAIPDAEWENVIRSYTSFSSWREMQEKAAGEYASKKLMAGL